MLCLDRAVLQSHRRYASLGLSLMVEIGVRTVLVLTFAELGWGIWGYALGLMIGEVVAAVQAHLSSRRAWDYAVQAALPADQSSLSRTLSIDLTAALIGFAFLGVLQNADIILVGRLHHANAGSYAAISVASKALVFGAILLGSYILPEASIRWHRGGHALRQLGVTLVFFFIPPCCSFWWRWPYPDSSSRCSSGRAWPGELRPSPPWSAPWPASGSPSSSPTTSSGRPGAGSSPFSASGWSASSS